MSTATGSRLADDRCLSVDDAGHRSLAVRDLLRGETTELPSGVTVARLVGAAPLHADELEQSRPEGTPLWLYILTSPSTAAVETGLVRSAAGPSFALADLLTLGWAEPRRAAPRPAPCGSRHRVS